MKTLRFLALLLVCAAITAIVLRWISLERWRKNLAKAEEEEPVRIIEPLPTPTPTPALPKTQVIGGKLETSRLFSGITVNATVEPTPGGPASDERIDPQSYVLDLKLHARVPTPNKTIEELARVNPELPRLLPGLANMVGADSVSPFFHELYETKIKRLRANLTRLDQLLSRHNFYDCQTILQLQHPETKRKAVLIQAEMDVDADGSDSDRLPAGSGVSTHFQPYTSYRWPKKTSNPRLSPDAGGAHQRSRSRGKSEGHKRRAQGGAEGGDRKRARWDRSIEEVQLPHWRDRSVHRYTRRIHEDRGREGR